MFVERGAERIYLGMSEPRTVRQMLGMKFPVYLKTYRELLPKQTPAMPPDEEVKQVAYGWPAQLPHESTTTERVSHEKLKDWLQDALASAPQQ